MTKLIDMHVHTTYSDGEYTPSQIIDMAITNNVGTLAITDHDTVLGLQALNNNYSNIKIIPGIEMTAQINKGTLHILGYGIDIYNKALNRELEDLRLFSGQRVYAVVEYIKKVNNIVFSDEDVQKMYNNLGNIGRPDIAKLCLKYGYVSSAQEAFDKYLIPAYEELRIDFKKISGSQACELIKGSGGIPVLAHPIQLKKSDDELDIYLEELVNGGLEGIEIYHSLQSDEYRSKLLKLAAKYKLLVSGGSDYHGPICKPNVALGSGIDNNTKIKTLSILNRL